MNVFAVLGRPGVVDRTLLGVYSTQEQAQALVDAQGPELRLWLRIEEVVLDRSPNSDFWEVLNARAISIADLAALVTRIVAESGSQESFEAKEWVLDWLMRPNPTLGCEHPEKLLDTEEGRRSLRESLGRMQAGVY